MSNILQRTTATGYDLTISDPLTVTGIDSVSINNLNLDAFLRHRVSLPVTQYEYNFQYNKAPLIWDELVSQTGASSHIQWAATVRLTTGDSNPVDLQKKIGYFEWYDGCFLGYDSQGYYLCIRSTSTGVTVDNKVYQSNWNVDPFNGNGASGITFDWTKTFIFVMDFEWLGVGTVECGFFINKQYYPAHRFHHSQQLAITYMGTANLPMRYEVSDGGDYIIRQTFQYFRYRPGKSLLVIMTANMCDGNYWLDQICATVITEGSNDQETSYQHSVNMGVTPKAIGTTKTALISVRPKQFIGSAINRSQLVHEHIDALVTGNGTIRWELVYNATLGGTPSWTSAGTNSTFEYDIAATTVTGGEIIGSGYTSSTSQVKQSIAEDVSAKYPLYMDILATGYKTLTLAAVSFSGTVDMIASMTLKEYY